MAPLSALSSGGILIRPGGSPLTGLEASGYVEKKWRVIGQWFLYSIGVCLDEKILNTSQWSQWAS